MGHWPPDLCFLVDFAATRAQHLYNTDEVFSTSDVNRRLTSLQCQQEHPQTVRLGETQRAQNVNTADLGPVDLEFCRSALITGANQQTE